MNKLFFLLLLLVCTACPNGSQKEISGQDWQLNNWTAGNLPKEVSITATFADGRLSGKGVCNQYFANATIQKDSLLITTVGATKMLCPKHNDIEQQYFQYLQKASTFKILKDGQLVIEADDVSLYFVPTKEE